ncbi:MAG: filamentous hemagglutinin N-terminal domain-containing protein [Nostoc sp.]|uniref:two-partner secretion domain-containing protein n=1 Tax=unclassified Nostoc TaxID=2593658 RepID=UPI0025F9C4E9|nr:filamentous hemagglutinin N-terminal domain-containing protein [Nostoc sp. NMS9]MBN3943588.1 filamentous hemagglutinin N-terminal domain-containing protein [Nostoc sp. NMS9]
MTRSSPRWCWKLAVVSWLVMGSAIGEAVLQTFAFSFNCAFAQITPDSTLPNNSRVTTQDNIRTIEGGTQAGSNLFHSFQEFSVPRSGTAFFNNAADIQNIISRVTGGSVSDIDGIIRTNGTANLFLINPNGIVFGQNAQLNIGGSFVASTANALQFGNIGFFSATDQNIPSPLLTINPSALLFNQINQNAAIQNNSVAPAKTAPTGLSTSGLRVPDGRSLLLVGGNISMDRGELNAFGGRVELGGLKGVGTVRLNGNENNLSLSFPDGVTRSDVLLTNGANVNVAGSNGSIAITARNIEVTEGSELHGGLKRNLGFPDVQAGDIELLAQGAITLANGFIRNTVEAGSVGNGGNINITGGSLFVIDGAQLDASTLPQSSLSDPMTQGNAGSVNINVSDTVSFDGKISGIRFTTGAFSSVGERDVGNRAVGNGGNINITTGSLSVKNGAVLDASNSGSGNAGNVNINARNTVSFDGSSNAYSTVVSGGKGNSSSINITTGSLSVTNGAQLLTYTNGQTDAGSVNINARDTVSFDGIGSNGLSSAAYSTVDGSLAVGNSGGINITTGSFSVTNGAELVVSTFGRGIAGSVNINARDTVSFDGVASNGRSSAAYSTTESTAMNNSGDINIIAESLSVTNGAYLTTRTLGRGNAGNVNINVRDSVSLDGVGSNGLSSQINNRVEEGATGRGGNIYITARAVSITQGAFLTTSTDGKGDAGSMIINAGDSVSFDGLGRDEFPGGVYSRVLRNANGQGGSISITAGTLAVTNGAQVTTSTRDQGDGGNITLHANTLQVFHGGQVVANTLSSGKAGNITVNIADSVTLAGSDPSYNARLAQFGQDVVSSAGPNSGLYSNTSENSIGQGGTIKVTTRQMLIRDGAQVAVNSQGAGGAGELEASARLIRLDNQAKLTAETTSGKGGNITLQNLDLLLLRRNSQISSTAGTEQQSGDGGNIIINAPNGFIVAGGRENSDITANAFSGSGGRVTINAASIFGMTVRTREDLVRLLGTNLDPQRLLTNDITAISQTSPTLSGTVTLNTPDIDLSRGLVNLPTVPVDTQVAQTCTAGSTVAKSSFTITGRGGLPPNPGEALSADAVQVDLVTLNPEVGKPSTPAVSTNPINPTPARIVEATGWVIAANGDVILTSSAPTVTPHSSWQRTADCRVFNQRQGG